ncbi:hypothetical protein [Aquipuribacter sp. MA13-6]|uniref:hypothetical protein n=1 Tax=unclassified Aquipuribacter TaxID=2635084 RepID=UPI003EEFB0A0
MELGSVRELKEAWLSRVAVRGVAGRAPMVGPVALGAAPRGAGYALAVRYRHEGPLVARLVGQLRDAVGDREVDVRRIGSVRPLTTPTPEQLQGRLRPLVPGCSICHEADTAGTLGGVVERDGERFLLSNSHVLARAGLASPGDVVRQPGPADGGRAQDRVGVLETAVPFDPAGANRVDAAIARPDPGVEVDLHPSGTARLDGDELVEKLGRTTGLTRGRVTAIEVDDVVVDLGEGVGLLRFDGQVEVSGTAGGPDGTAGPFSRGGDSGSLVRLAGGGRAVGLLFAGSEAGGDDGFGLTFCNVVDDVLDELGAILLG